MFILNLLFFKKNENYFDFYILPVRMLNIYFVERNVQYMTFVSTFSDACGFLKHAPPIDLYCPWKIDLPRFGIMLMKEY